MLEVVISLKYKRLSPERYDERDRNDSDNATWKKIREIKDKAATFYGDADRVFVDEVSLYDEKRGLDAIASKAPVDKALVHQATNQLLEDVRMGDLTAIAELLEKVEPKYLSGYLAQQSSSESEDV